jgi:hypothetical protein
METLKNNIKSLRFWGALAAGAVLGYGYYYFVGCNSGGSCAITASPVNSVAYGLFAGGLLGWRGSGKDACGSTGGGCGCS